MIRGFLFFIGLLFFVSCQQNTDKTFKNYDWDNDGMLIIRGQRTFITGTYHLPKSDDPYLTLQENGYNLVQVPADKEALDAAHDHDLFTWIGTGILNTESVDKDKNRLANLINDFKDHPSLLLWEIADEPAFTWNSPEARISPDKMIETYQYIRQLDSEHYVYTNHGPVNLISTLQKYNPATDIIACDIYPVIPHGIKPTYALFEDGLQGDLLNPYLSQVGEYVDKMMQVAEGNHPLLMVLQGFSWEMLKEINERDPSMIQYPTYKQSRFMAYNAIVHGAVGINYWGTSYTPQPSPFMDDLNRLTKELAEMRSVLSAQKTKIEIGKEYHELGHSIDTGVEILTKKADGNLYLITVNSDKNPVKVTFSGFNDYVSATVLQEDRTLNVISGELTDQYEPFDTHIYLFK
jgi:hypothetical protein